MIGAGRRIRPVHRLPYMEIGPLLASLVLLAACGEADPGGDARIGEPSNGSMSSGAIAPAAMLDVEGAGPESRQEPTDLAELERLWSSERYEEALPLLIRYRKTAPYGRNEVVDYMIATSACRVAGQEELGRKVLNWVLAHYSLNPASREVVRSELDRCTPSGAVPVSLVLVGAGPTSTSGTRGKMYYMLTRGEELPLANEPIEVHREIPIEEFESRLMPPERADEAVARVQDLAGPGYRVVAADRFVFASRIHSTEEMRAIAAALGRYADFYAETYGIPLPPDLVTVYLTSSGQELREIADRVHGIGISAGSIGYSFRDDLSMVGIIPRQIYGTLAHELFHLMVRRHFGDVPPWLDEGISALYEVSRITGDGSIRGTPNWRGPVLRELWHARPTVEELVRADWRAFEAVEDEEPVSQATNHAMARYFVLYLQEQDRLPEVYRAFRDRNPLSGGAAPPDPVAVLEGVLDLPSQELDRRFVEWFQSLTH